EATLMLADARRIEAQTVERILDSVRVLCATTTGLSAEVLGERRFDLCVIDEAAQSTEPAAWLPILRSRRLVLAGDHQQLPPTVISAEAAAQGFGISLMERLMQRLGAEVSRQLTVQYRMHQAIMQFSSAEFYEASLIADASVRNHLLADLPSVETNELTTEPLTFIDTAGASYDEEIEPDGESRLNPSEALLVVNKVKALLEAGLSPQDIAVITPYAAQVRWLRAQLPHAEVEIDSVDGFQGREKEAVIISLVRSNETGEIGFLGDTRRMNVALTRARRKLLIIGDSATITAHPFYRRLVDYFEQAGAYRSVWEEM
ncbi:MAG TPA: IGHMBP2 family helicase, partial [Anaerolineae bacterium]|nr:IGHMBP2 family helicase [Anaerolineae bacterium]